MYSLFKVILKFFQAVFFFFIKSESKSLPVPQMFFYYWKIPTV